MVSFLYSILHFHTFTLNGHVSGVGPKGNFTSDNKSDYYTLPVFFFTWCSYTIYTFRFFEFQINPSETLFQSPPQFNSIYFYLIQSGLMKPRGPLTYT